MSDVQASLPSPLRELLTGEAETIATTAARMKIRILLRLQYGERFFASENQHGCSGGIDDHKVAVASGFSEIMCLIVWGLSSCQRKNLVFGSFRVKTKNKHDRRLHDLGSHVSVEDLHIL